MKEMTLLEHLQELRHRLIRIVVTVGVFTLFCFTFGLREARLFDRTILYPYPDIWNNIAALFLRRLKGDLLPEHVDLITTTPAQVVYALVSIALFLGVIMGMPMVIYQLWKFVGPALYSHEKSLVVKMVVPSMVLFILGGLFAYHLMIPFTLEFLFKYASAVEVTAYLTIESFISFILGFIIAFGLAFQIPLVMTTLTSAGLVEPRFWKENFRYTVLAMCFFGAAITPDGSGITMFMVAAPLIVLYGIGCLLAYHRKVK